MELWDPENGNRISILDGASGEDIKVLCEISIDGHRMLAGSDYGKSVQLWDPADRHLLSPREAQRDIELMGTIRTGGHIFFACNAFDTVVLQDPREIFKNI